MDQLPQVIRLLETDSNFRDEWIANPDAALTQHGLRKLEATAPHATETLAQKLERVNTIIQHSLFGA